MNQIDVPALFPEPLRFLFKPHRYKVAWGGRGGAKSWGFARALLIQGVKKPLRILCARETQKSISDSVHKLLCDQIEALKFHNFYATTKTSIVGRNGTEFLYAGIRQNITNLKSYEGCDIVWVEEAQTVSKRSWNGLIPTIRKDNSEIWVSFNPELETDDTYLRFITYPPTDCACIKINWRDNPWFPLVLRNEMRDLRKRSEEEYQHIYEGMCKQVVEGAIYRAELIAVDKEQRITSVPWDSRFPVDTFWDLGWGDNTSIWFAQSIGFEFRIIEHFSGSLQNLAYYAKELRTRPYHYGAAHLPHDARAHELGSGKTIEEQLRAMGFTVKVARKMSLEDGIAAVRSIFPKCYFDKEKCPDGLQSLRHYRYDRDEDLGTFRRAPLHDWASHDADAFRTLAIQIKEQERPEERRDEQDYNPWRDSSSRPTSGSWMQ